jgi:uncharacterized protein (DUF2235 family)
MSSAYGHYERATASKKSSPEDECKKFRDILSHVDVKVHFVGAWSVFVVKRVYVMVDAVHRDTVSSVGIRRKPTLPETTNGMTHVCAFRHALALDEVRVRFLPEYVRRGLGPGEHQRQAVEEDPGSERRKVALNVKEVWFAGSHSDM